MSTEDPHDGLAVRVSSWQRAQGRHDLPWQNTHDPYRIWLSEIMLQQTQVTTVIPYYLRFLERFPDLQALAEATQEDVMPYWAGLGYYARARNLHRCAVQICALHEGRFPRSAAEIATLPGIGRSTAAAIAAFAYGERSPILDGNVKRVFARYFAVEGYPGLARVERTLWAHAEAIIDQAPDALDMTSYTQGLMDLGARLCRRGEPLCTLCPLADGCKARRLGLQTRLPEARPRRAVPERHCSMLILRTEDHVLLEKQPENGIWGGLWSLPRFDTAEALQTECRHRGLTLNGNERMAGLVHVFTHFRLHIDPWVVSAAHLTEEPSTHRAWVAARALSSTALPAPVLKLLQGVFEGVFELGLLGSVATDAHEDAPTHPQGQQSGATIAEER